MTTAAHRNRILELVISVRRATLRLGTARSAPRWLLLLLLGSNIPLFLCMPLTADTVLYDLQARTVVQGGVLYRDVFEVNLPGVVWLHMVIRGIGGPSSVAMRVADLLIFTSIVLLLARWVSRMGGSPTAQGWTVLFLYWFYFSLSEWCHCQRDTWMLLPALLAVDLQCGRIHLGPGLREKRKWAIVTLLQGVCWGLAVWIKPHVIVPAVATWVAGVRREAGVNRIGREFLLLLSGGLFVGASGVAWLWATGAWPWLIEILLQWIPEYMAFSSRSIAQFAAVIAVSLWPWFVVHCVAVPLAVRSLVRNWTFRTSGTSDTYSVQCTVFAALYLGWLLQTVLLQHAHAYVQIPSVLLAVVVVVAEAESLLRSSILWKAACATFVAWAVLTSPALKPARLQCWWPCVHEGSTARLRDRLSEYVFPEFQQLKRVAGYLRSRSVSDGEVTCYSNSVLYLYRDLEIDPPSRFAFPRELIAFFPTRADEILRSLAESPQKYIVADLEMEPLVPTRSRNQRSSEGPTGRPQLPVCADPRHYPVVFRTSRYRVYRVTGSDGAASTEAVARDRPPAASL